MLPVAVQNCLWSFDLKKVDPELHKRRIILNVLNLGSREANKWLFAYYSRELIKDVVMSHGALGELSPKSLNYWCLILELDISKLKKTRF